MMPLGSAGGKGKPVDELGAKVALLRANLGLSPSELARRMEVTPQYIQKLEKGDIKNPGIDKLRLLALHLHTTIGYLLGEQMSFERSVDPAAPWWQRLRQRREVLRMSQEDLAFAADVPVFVVQALEEGKEVLPGRATMIAISKALGAPPYGLFTAPSRETGLLEDGREYTMEISPVRLHEESGFDEDIEDINDNLLALRDLDPGAIRYLKLMVAGLRREAEQEMMEFERQERLTEERGELPTEGR